MGQMLIPELGPWPREHAVGDAPVGLSHGLYRTKLRLSFKYETP
jgi:hypothetical protein